MKNILHYDSICDNVYNMMKHFNTCEEIKISCLVAWLFLIIHVQVLTGFDKHGILFLINLRKEIYHDETKLGFSP